MQKKKNPNPNQNNTPYNESSKPVRRVPIYTYVKGRPLQAAVFSKKPQLSV